VIGAGWAGEGHTLALKHSGVDVVAICARQPDVVRAVADRLGVPEASVDWRRTLESVKPEIVSLATPASLRGEVVEAAVEMGCHIFCDKPLAVDAGEAKRLYNLAGRAGIRHAYAATALYDPSIAWMAELVRDGAIGALREIDRISRFPQPFPPTLPWNWGFTLSAGGGLLNNMLPHMLGSLERVIGGPLLRATGEARALRHSAPVVPDIHDFRQLLARIPTPEEAAKLEWCACDFEEAASALLRFASPAPGRPEIQVTAILSSLVRSTWPPNGWRIYGDGGTLVAAAPMPLTITLQRSPDTEPEPMPVPQRLTDALPQIEDGVLMRWAALARDFVADVQGQPHQPYLTFYDGWRYQEAIDAVRDARGWHEIPTRA
jgi:predicted dehydrogenase